MVELKISKKDSDQNFGWRFENTDEAKEFVKKLQDSPNCPYAPIVELDERGEVISVEPHPDWDIAITPFVDEEKPKDDARKAARESLKELKKLVKDAKEADSEKKIQDVLVALAEGLLAVSKIIGTSDVLDS